MDIFFINHLFLGILQLIIINIGMQSRKSSILQRYQPIRAEGILITLGFGAYGIVELGRCIATKEKVAIKKIGRKIVLKQVQIHKKLHHNNIIKMIDYQYDQKQECTYIILEYAENGSLFDLIRYGGLKNKKMVKEIFYAVCIAIDYLHSMNIMHRDIKPQNILLDRNNKVKVCDFGFATENSEPRHTICGTVQYMAPQMILKKAYSHKIDIWGLGILLFQLIQGRAPFDGKTQDEVLQKMKKPLYFSSNFSSDQMELVHKILKVDPNERPEIKQILKSPYLFNHPKLSTESSGKMTSTSTNQRKSTLSQQYQKEDEKQRQKYKQRESQQQSNRIKIIKVVDLKTQKQKSDKKNSFNIQITSVRDLNAKEQAEYSLKSDKQKSQKFMKSQKSEKGQKFQKAHPNGGSGNKISLRPVNPNYRKS